MSHIVEVQTEVRDPAAVRAACSRLNLPEPVQGTTRLFSDEATGLAVQLPGWRNPIVCDTQSGNIRYDNFGGHWGDKGELDRFLQMYAVEKVKIESRRRGNSTTETLLGDGSIKLTVNVGGAS